MSSYASRPASSVGGAEVSAPLLALIPPGPGCPLEEFNPIIRAQEEAMYYAENATREDIVCEVNVFEDKELGVEVVELIGPETRLEIPVRCELPFFVAHLKDTEKFCSIVLKVVDHEKRVRTLEMNSKLTATRIGKIVSMPLVLVPGWNHLLIDLPDMVSRAFGTSYQYCKDVTVTANCVVGRLFFQDRAYEDVELPSFLRVLEDDGDD